ncbi:MAG: HIT family protein [Pseudomonadota bacterium]
MIEGFVLHERLAQDTVAVADLGLSALLLMQERRWPWLILVPRRAGVSEIADLVPADRALLVEEIAAATRLLQALYRPDKVNVAAIGNLVPQLHLHVVARYRNDPVWPKPIWGQLPPEPYEKTALDDRLAELRHALTQARHRH